MTVQSKEHINLSEYSVADLKAMLDFAKNEVDRMDNLIHRDDNNDRLNLYKDNRELWHNVYYRIEEEIYKRIEKTFEFH